VATMWKAGEGSISDAKKKKKKETKADEEAKQ
jgi:hypothetical protein